MSKVYMTKLFMNGGSQAVRIPAEFRFEQSEVAIWQDNKTGRIQISAMAPSKLDKFFELQQKALKNLSKQDLELFVAGAQFAEEPETEDAFADLVRPKSNASSNKKAAKPKKLAS